MKNQLSIQEKLWDLRRDHDYKLEEVAAAVNVVPATISKYENKENKEYNIVTLNKLAEFYGVSLEWLVGRYSPADYSAEESRCQRPVPESSGKLSYSGRRIFFPYHSQ